MSADGQFCQTIQRITEHGGHKRLTEIYLVGQRIDGKVKITSCYGKSAPYKPNTNAVDHAA